jgi:hypothetical protein
VVFTEHYRKLAAEYFSFVYYCRYTTLNAREHKQECGDVPGGDSEIKIRLAVRALGSFCLRHRHFIYSVGKICLRH